jgi:hypothetical protein
MDMSEEIIEAKESKEDMEEKDFSARKWIIGTLIAAIILTVIIFAGAYLAFVHSSKKVVNETAKVYASGSGEDLVELICPQYVSYYKENYNFSDINNTYQGYVDEFRAEVSEAGDIQDIDVDIDNIMGISNVDELASEFAQYGVTGVTKYMEVDMTWHIDGQDSDIDVGATAFIMKCQGKWYLDYISFSWD